MSPPRSSTKRSAIRATDLSLLFHGKDAALEGVNLTVGHGEFVSIVGPSGCGKSSLLRLVAGLESATAGDLKVDAPQQPARAGFVFQQPTLLPWRTAAANIGLPLELQHQQTQEIDKAVGQARRLVGLTSTDMSKLPRMLSGGMQMRVSIARALVTEPQIMLLDEPFAALDDLLRGELNEELIRLWQQQAWTTLFVTHNVDEAVLLSQRVLVMSPAPGRIAADINVPLPFPREVTLRGTPEYAAIVGTVSQALRDSAQAEPSV